MNTKQVLRKNNSFSSNFTLNCRSKVIKFERPVVMGILNITPDSFYDGGRYVTEKDYLGQAERMIGEGAAIIDIGAASSRPGAAAITEDEELRRLLPALQTISKHFPEILLSVDTYRAAVAKSACEHGADIINDISGGTMDAKMFAIIAGMKVPYVLMHIKGTPLTMQDRPVYKDVVAEIMDHFTERVSQLKKMGAGDIIIDPGIGFGKDVEDNYEILRNLDRFLAPGWPLMIGLSRKSLINKVLGISPEDALNGTTVLNTVAVLKGAHILRVHDIKEAIEVIRLCEYLQF
ncbi:MAG: dihydropteroate synthase [Bacteroidetes bacterium]|nr:dihydropteroate synthase [Bacteroidota bacterium]